MVIYPMSEPFTIENLTPIQSVIEETLLGKKAISDIFESELSTQPTVAYGIPVLRNNQIIGSLVALDVLHITTDENDATD